MVLENLIELLTFGAFGSAFVGTFIFGAIEFLGRIYGTYRCLVREDLTAEQRLIYLVLIWIIPLGWLIYFLLGTERTQRLFAEVDVF